MKYLILAMTLIFIGCGETKDKEQIHLERLSNVYKYFTPLNEYGEYTDNKSFEVVVDNNGSYVYMDVLTTDPLFIYNEALKEINLQPIEDMNISIRKEEMTLQNGLVSYVGTKDVGLTKILVDNDIVFEFTY